MIPSRFSRRPISFQGVHERLECFSLVSKHCSSLNVRILQKNVFLYVLAEVGGRGWVYTLVCLQQQCPFGKGAFVVSSLAGYLNFDSPASSHDTPSSSLQAQASHNPCVPLEETFKNKIETPFTNTKPPQEKLSHYRRRNRIQEVPGFVFVPSFPPPSADLLTRVEPGSVPKNRPNGHR